MTAGARIIVSLRALTAVRQLFGRGYIYREREIEREGGRDIWMKRKRDKRRDGGKEMVLMCPTRPMDAYGAPCGPITCPKF